MAQWSEMLLFAESVLFCMCPTAVTSSVVWSVPDILRVKKRPPNALLEDCASFLKFPDEKHLVENHELLCLFSMIHECMDLGILPVCRGWTEFTS